MAGYLRDFDWSIPLTLGNQKFPTTTMGIEEPDGTVKKRQVFIDSKGNYYGVENGMPIPVMMQHNLDEVVVTPSKEVKRGLLSDAFNKYLTMSNDKTKVNNAPHREYNPHLKDAAVRGAKDYALWDKQHPNVAAWRDVATAAPFGVIAAPFMDGVASTALGQGITRGLGFFADAVKYSRLFPWIDAAATSLSGAKGLQDIQNGTFTPETALDVTPLAQVAKPIYKAARSFLDLGKPVFGEKSEYDFNKMVTAFNDEANKVKSDYPLNGETEIPLNIRRNAANKYRGFINSEEYQSRLKKAGLENHGQYMTDLTDREINNIGYFPSKVQSVIDGDPEVLGQSISNPNSTDYGITLKEALGVNEISPALNHEIAHFATGSAGIEDSKNMLNPNFFNTPNTGYIGDIMRHNENIAPNISWEDIKLPELTKRNPTLRELDEEFKRYTYLTNPQEKRARAYSIYQQAKEAGMSTDKFVDKYTENGKIVDKAPMQLQQMGEILTLEDLKKYLRNFLSIAAPIGISNSRKE